MPIRRLTSSPCQKKKRKEKMSDTGAAARESTKTTSAPSRSRTMAVATSKKQSVIDLTIQVGDTDVAIREIEARLGRVNARIIERQHRKGSEFLKAEMGSRMSPCYWSYSKRLAGLIWKRSPLVVPDGDVTVGIKSSLIRNDLAKMNFPLPWREGHNDNLPYFLPHLLGGGRRG